MKRFLYLALCFLLAISMTLCFVACGEEEEKPEVPNSNTSSSTAGNDKVDNENNNDEDSENNGDNTGDNTQDVVVHEHTFATEYSYDAENHYYAATCEHSDEKSGVEAHEYDEVGNCKCGYYKLPEITSIAQAIEIAKANGGKLVTSIMTTTTSSNYTGSVTYGAAWTEFGEDYVRILTAGEYVEQYFYALDKNGNVFGVYIQVPFAPQVDMDATEESMKGYKFYYWLDDETEIIANGVEAFVEALYLKALSLAEEGAEVGTVDGNKFSFVIALGEEGDISVEFAINEEGVISNANISITSYSEFGTSYVYEVEQSTSNKSNPFDPDSVKLDSYVITDKDGNNVEGNVINAEVGTPVEFFFTEISPVTADLNLSVIDFTFVDQNGNSPWLWPYFDETTNSYSITLYTPGTYTVTIMVDGVETVTTIEIPFNDTTSIGVEVFNPIDYVFEEKTEISMYVGKSISFKSLVGEYEDPAFVAEILGEIAETVATLTDGEEDGKAVKVFTANEVGTYTIKLTSTKVETLSCELTVNVLETPDVAAMLNGFYKGTNEWGLTNIFATFKAETETTGTVEITYKNSMSSDEAVVGVFSYAYTDGVISYEYVSGDDVATDIYVSDNYELVISANDGYDYVLEPAEPVEPSEPAEEATTGTITVKDNANNGQNNGTYTYSISEDGAITIYRDGVEAKDVMITIGIDGSYMFQCAGLARPQPMNKVEGEDGLFSGKYTINFIVNNAFEITVEADAKEEATYSGQIIVTDNVDYGKNNGTYDYILNADGSVTVYKDGVETNEVIIAPAIGGGYLFQCAGIANAQPMNKVDGSADEFAGTYSVNFISNNAFEIVITSAAGETEAEIVTGTLDIVDNNNGRKDVDGQYTFEYVNDVFTIYKDGEVTDTVKLAYDENGNLTFACTTSGNNFNVANKKDDSEGLAGSYGVNSVVMNDLWTFVITVDEATGSDDEENAGITAAELAGTAWQYENYMMILEIQSDTAFYLFDTSYAFELIGTYTIEGNTIIFDIDEAGSSNVDIAIPLEITVNTYANGTIVIKDSFGDLVFHEIQQ